MGAVGFRALFAAALLATSCTSIAADRRTFDGGGWRVTAINGHATPATSDYYLTFSGNEVGGRVGCNGFGGRYAIARDRMTVGEVRSTRMACSNSAGSFESDTFGILSQPLRMDWASASRMSLVNDLGSLALERLP